MKRQDFTFQLPPELIARHPLDQRRASRMLHLPAGEPWQDRQFSQLIELLRPGDLLVLNNSKVIPARVFGEKISGGRVEVLLERVLDTQHALVKLRASKAPKPGATLCLFSAHDASVRVTVEMTERRDDLFVLRFPDDALEFFEQYGAMPLPPYIERAVNSTDSERYQTVYAEDAGSVAAPTAGLHFDHAMLESLAAAEISLGYVTLHVGSGTYQPVRVDKLEDHKMHAERVTVSEHLVEQIEKTQAQGGRVIAVGTTSLRSLESAARSGKLCAFSGDTDIFIYPGYRFQVVDVLLTNFHLPESTLLMLVSALAGRERILAAYQHAIEQQYRFFSYGDCMLIERKFALNTESDND